MTVRYEEAAPRIAQGSDRGREEISIPARRQFFIGAFLLFWLGGWTVGGVKAIEQLSKTNFQPFLLFWLGGWVIGELMAAGTLIWMFAGREVIVASPSAGLEIAHRVFKLARRKHYRVDLIRELRQADARPQTGPQPSMPFATEGNSRLRFDYGGRTVHFGIGLDDAEARHVMDFLKARLPRSAFATS